MLASVIHQHESVIGVHMSLPSHPSRLSQSPALRSLSHIANSRWLSLSHVVVCVSVPRSPFVPPSPVPRVSTSLFSVCVTSIAIIAIAGGAEDGWRCLEGFTAEMPLGLSSQIGIHKMERERRVY